ncbi:MAG: hypothetical protein AAF800_00680 [Planctomycetota bacterium]
MLLLVDLILHRLLARLAPAPAPVVPGIGVARPVAIRPCPAPAACLPAPRRITPRGRPRRQPRPRIDAR